MKKINIGQSGLTASEISLGIMRMNALSNEEAKTVIETAIHEGIDYFDHADIYGKGESEQIFGQAFKELGISRDKVMLQTKTGIVPGVMFDFSKEHIIESVEASLKRLQTDYVDTLLLHRPDTLVEPEEVAAAFDELEKTGKVRYFGVSNQNPLQIELLKKYVQQPLIANQLQLSITHTPMIDAGFNVNMVNEASVFHDGGILEYSRIHDMTIQPWSPFQSGNEKKGLFFDHPDYPELNELVNEMAAEKSVAREAIAIAWLLRHPAHMQPIVGSMNPERIKAICQASEITLTREEWYKLYQSTGKTLP
ncbi:aldo/keto reductase [Desemzia sp. RIT804]|uniref:aldo/keto reductase n=1 Tax=Desemzia sp. RIT 804 TaxID=2810209 RepID=UPI0019508B9D|nr:aldo/keto reductase [Desemzia sp. RIT 804]